MTTLLEWSADLPEWARDALRRIAVSDALPQEDRDAVKARIRIAQGIAVNGEHPCVPLGEDHLPAAAGDGGATILCGLGPVQNVDRLANDQELRMAVEGITLVYGHNGSGKSGYARVAKKLCQARVVDALRGDVFADAPAPPAEARVRYRMPNQEVREERWLDGEAALTALKRINVLDSANARAYIDRESEITFLPREIEIVTRLGELYSALSTEFAREADAIAQQYRVAYAVGRSLVPATAFAEIPSEQSLRDAGAWDEVKAQELADLTAMLSQDPRALARARRRISDSLTALADSYETANSGLSDERVAAISARIASARTTAQAAALSARERFADQVIEGTGTNAWRLMFEHARQFAAESGLRQQDEAFQEGDPCPTCQNPLDAAGAQRLQRFDDFVHSRATANAEAARNALDQERETLQGLQIAAGDATARALAEYRALGEAEAATFNAAIDFEAGLRHRCATLLAGIETGQAADVAALPDNVVGRLRAEIVRVDAEAAAFEARPDGDPALAARAAELRDAKRLSEELEAALLRRAELVLRQRVLNCKAALATEPVSRFTTQRRRELVTPELRRRIEDEVKRLDLSHIPLRVAESTSRGRNFFDLALDTRQNARKSQVLSEGEQTALGLACFLAEISRIPGNHGIIVDDPVSSLDHQRLRKVAERLVDEATAGRQIIVFTHNLVFYQEVISAAAAHNPPVPLLQNLICKSDAGGFGIVTENDEPWIAKKVAQRIEVLRTKLATIPNEADRESEAYRALAKDFYTDLRETWERLVEEVLLGGVVERYGAAVKTQSLKGVVVEDEDYRTIFHAMRRVSERSGHDMPAGRQIPVPDKAEIGRDLDAIVQYRTAANHRKNRLEQQRRALENPPAAQVG
ncbi:MAG: AAA family ATPase [Alphaproteobacteria bacterium]|nr:AAA family ATPase [Alphaproteobacteria bacterium]